MGWSRIRKVAVIGAGTMGRGIAQVVAAAGHEAVLYDVDAGQLERALAGIAATLDKGVRLGKVAEADRDAALARLAGTGTLREAVKGAELVIEAVPEVMALKKEVLAEVEAVAEPRTYLATNTSSLSVSEMAAGLRRPGFVVGLHFFNPVHIMALVEVVEGGETNLRTINAAQWFVKGLDKESILVHDSPGFATSRLGIVLGLEAIRMVEAGVASAADIDKAMVLGYRHPIGPLRLTDLVGLDVRLDIARHLHSELGSEAFRPPALLERMVAEGRLGKKSGRGFYEWEDES
ncbi:MAG: 3-hydroxyacyl-CoA dehydrogenase family protein [Gemmatimonadetes bacterium]|nr:3-hydroxyacyl-CoA dehydrogenase family protein [Gemmatimonadota bacterium]MYA11870.1 3-hydroxyacyl-CoA dehydrogenase family protein [Gemmatimonadota bacterium]MYE70158.1 3-hydroxyacyl-CoA dehydrogenase family protein [Gemmatimonadota bacterium]MYJ67290.1 3-hydroxyacyl-CoA dehydrogenase family protein [Gemmatimonadota bacterium]